jgi:molybdenum cofactor guanylyltransferase
MRIYRHFRQVFRRGGSGARSCLGNFHCPALRIPYRHPFSGCYHSGMQLAGFVLAGGLSTRMGRDKAMLDWRGEPLLAHLAREVASVARSVVVLGPPARYQALGFPCWSDLHLGLGPIGALETALHRTSDEWNLLVAVDLPGVDRSLLAGLGRTAFRAGKRQATVIREVESSDEGGAGSRVHPLCGIYLRSALAAVQDAIRRNDLRMMNLLSRLNPVYHDIPYRLANLNQPEDWSAFLASSRSA